MRENYPHRITARRTLLELVERLGIPIRVAMFSSEILHAADEIFVTSTAGRVMPVTQLDGKAVGDGEALRTTMTLRTQYGDTHKSGPWTQAIE